MGNGNGSLAPSVPGLRFVDPRDGANEPTFVHIAERIKDLPQVWDPFLRQHAPTLSFLYRYVNPANMVFDLGDGDGVVVFHDIKRGHRALMTVAVWGREAMRRVDLLKAAGVACFLVHDLLAVEAYVREDNHLSRRLSIAGGFRERGRLSNYDAQGREDIEEPKTIWFEILREEVGLPPVGE